jgi:hypothetical protein
MLFAEGTPEFPARYFLAMFLTECLPEPLAVLNLR